MNYGATNVRYRSDWTTLVKAVGNMSLQNVIMQCRKATCHPFLFYWPRDRNTQQPLVSKELVRASGKMMLLDRLLEALIGENAKIDPKTKKPHKVLVFSQFTRMLDIIEVSHTSLLTYPCLLAFQ